MSDAELDFALGDVFTEVPRPPSPDPTTVIYTRPSRSPTSDSEKEYSLPEWSEVEITLVGSHPLWGHYLWNAARAFASFLDTYPSLYVGRSVLELGAGGGLPGIVAAKNGARHVVLTDYPDPDLIKNLRLNIEKNTSGSEGGIVAQGYVWGNPVKPLFQSLGSSSGFDLIIMSDLVFNHSEHYAILKTCALALSSSATVLPLNNTWQSPPPPPSLLVFYTHHRPHLAHRDLEFFDKARAQGWKCDKIVTEKFAPMFPDDPGEEEMRATVHGWRLTRLHDRAPDS